MLQVTMFIHLRYGSEKEYHIMEFDEGFISVLDVLCKARKRYGKYSRLQLFDEHGKLLKSSDIVKEARIYRVKRHSR